MGNRAVLALKSQPTIGVYLHWSGSPDQVNKILNDVASYARKPGEDATYAFARLVECCCKAEGARKETGCGVGPLTDLDCDNMDNGIYWIGDDWTVLKHDRRPHLPVTAL